MKQRILAGLLAACMLLLSLPLLVLPAAAEEGATATIEDYIAIAEALEPKNDKQRAIRGQMLVEYAAYQLDMKEMDAGMISVLMEEVAEKHAAYMQQFQYGFIEETGLVMTFAVFSDVHITNNNNTGTIRSAISNLLQYNPDPIGIFVTGDLSDNGLCPSDQSYSDLDNYYAFVKNHDFVDSKGEQIKITSILGNHDIRGPWALGYSKSSYAPAVEMYLEQEGVETLCHDTWINGYHFVFMNPAKWATDDCCLSAENIAWLDETLSQDQSGKPQFVFIHQYASRVIEDADSPYTFEEVIARHPSTVVSSGHGHYGFGSAFVYEDAGSYYINQPGLVSNTGVFNTPSYYIVDVYEGGVIYRGITASGKWVPEGDVVIPNMAYAEKGKCSYYFYDENGGLLLQGSVAEGGVPTIPTAPTKASDAQYSYPFAGWDLNGDGAVDQLPTALTSNLNATAVYTPTPREYTYTFIGAEGEELRKMTAGYGAALRIPGVKNLFGWDLDGDGAAEQLPEFVEGDMTAVAILKEEGKLTYTFIDKDGYVIEKGQVASGTTIKAPNFAPTYHAGDYFAGWDLNGDGSPDELPTTGITADFTATAIFYPTSQVELFFDGTTDSISYYMSYQGRLILHAENCVHPGSPTGNAAHVVWDGVKDYQYGAQLNLALPQAENTPVGYAIWIDAPGATGSYSFSLYKGKDFSHLVGETVNGLIYFVSEDGKVSAKNIDTDVSLPAGFTGWMVIPTATFAPKTASEPFDVLKLYFHRTKSGTILEKELYLGGGFSFGCTVDEMNEMLSTGFSTFYDAEGEYITTTFAQNGKPVVPEVMQSYTDEKGTYTFAGWDLNGDGVADPLPEQGSMIARAVYDLAPNTFTYRFVDANGKVYYERTAAYGSIVIPPTGSVITDASGTHTITAYLNYEKGMRLTGDTTYLVTAETVPSTYTVKFVSDGTVVSETTLAYGAPITAPAVPAKNGHTGVWEGYTEGMTVSGNVTFQAVYTATGNNGGGCGSTISGGVYAVMALLALGTGFVACRRREEE
ncbi:MAG: InlB B-repeat-containing protein [Clostridia bacterium]|nr:InlB B-repeat-containing protein [Clostridia bacterium]